MTLGVTLMNSTHSFVVASVLASLVLTAGPIHASPGHVFVVPTVELEEQKGVADKDLKTLTWSWNRRVTWCSLKMEAKHAEWVDGKWIDGRWWSQSYSEAIDCGVTIHWLGCTPGDRASIEIESRQATNPSLILTDPEGTYTTTVETWVDAWGDSNGERWDSSTRGDFYYSDVGNDSSATNSDDNSSEQEDIGVGRYWSQALDYDESTLKARVCGLDASDAVLGKNREWTREIVCGDSPMEAISVLDIQYLPQGQGFTQTILLKQTFSFFAEMQDDAGEGDRIAITQAVAPTDHLVVPGASSLEVGGDTIWLVLLPPGHEDDAVSVVSTDDTTFEVTELDSQNSPLGLVRRFQLDGWMPGQAELWMTIDDETPGVQESNFSYPIEVLSNPVLRKPFEVSPGEDPVNPESGKLNPEGKTAPMGLPE